MTKFVGGLSRTAFPTHSTIRLSVELHDRTNYEGQRKMAFPANKGTGIKTTKKIKDEQVNIDLPEP